MIIKIVSILLFAIFSISLQAQWVQNPTVPIHAQVTDIDVQGSYAYAVTQYGRIFVSSNCGITWTQMDAGVPESATLSDVIIKGNTIYIAAGHLGVYRSMDNGMNWESFSTGLTDTVLNLYTYKGDLYAGTKGSGIFVNENNSNTWTQVSLSGLPQNPVILGFHRDGKTLFMAVYQYGIYRSTDKGMTWVAVNNGLIQPPNSSPTTFLNVGNTLFAGISNAGVYVTTNNGDSWVKRSTGLNANGNYLEDLMTIGSLIAISSSGAVNVPGRGLYVTSDRGMTWYPKNEGFVISNDYNIQALEICDTVLIGGTNGAGIWTRSVNELNNNNAAVNNSKNQQTALNGNYPNPFNPVTVISFNLPARGTAQLFVYDITGKVVNTLVDGVIEPGEHNITFDASHLASGIYYYKLVTANHTETKKMILLK